MIVVLDPCIRAQICVPMRVHAFVTKVVLDLICRRERMSLSTHFSSSQMHI